MAALRRTVPRPHRAGAATARSVQHAIARIDRKLQEDEHEKNTLGGGLTHSAGGGKEKGEAEEESEMREGERQSSGSPMLCAIPLLALSVAHHGKEAVMSMRQDGGVILCERFYFYLRFHHLSRGL